ncbi:MAG TPA: T9SS type A sorting domain-containing protein [bacterium]|nr:T9SS type A sorting domain-containing protein [bacterium]
MKSWKSCIVVLLAIFIRAPVFAQIGPEYGSELSISCNWPNKSRYQIIDWQKSNPAWSPDGQWIAFTDIAGRGIGIVSPEGGESVPVYELWDTDLEYKAYIEKVCFTPDSQEITFQLDVEDPENGSYHEYLDGGAFVIKNQIPVIESVNINNGEHRVLIFGGAYPSWSPDGRYLAYINFDINIFSEELETDHHGVPAIYDTMTGETRFLLDDEQQTTNYYNNKYRYPSFSPDGSQLIFVVEESGLSQIYKIPFDGGETVQLTSINVNAKSTRLADPQYSPDGEWIIFHYSWELLVFKTLTDEVFKVFTGEKYVTPQGFLSSEDFDDWTVLWTIHQSWSPNGDKFCYRITRGRKDTGVNYYEDELPPDTMEDPTLGGIRYKIWTCDFDPDKYSSEKATSVEIGEPMGFGILSNYPNPFNVSTAIEFSISEAGFVTLYIYNITGQKINTLISGNMYPGTHSILWNGRNEKGNSISSGMYLLLLRTNYRIKSHRIMLMK